MAERNYMNVNEVYPILDLINRKVNQGKGVSHHFESPLLGGDSRESFDSSQWQVESFEVVRDTTNAIDPNIIKQVIIIYRNGAIDTISLTRGLNPPVANNVPDSEYINNLMIVEVKIETQWFDRFQNVTATIFKENGYGNFQRVELTYDDSEWHDHEHDETDGESNEGEYYENPNDFYDGESDEGYDEDLDEAEDFADSEYTEEDELEMPDDGWADGYNPSNPVDVDVTDTVDVDPNAEEI